MQGIGEKIASRGEFRRAVISRSVQAFDRGQSGRKAHEEIGNQVVDCKDDKASRGHVRVKVPGIESMFLTRNVSREKFNGWREK